jgi:transposase
MDPREQRGLMIAALCRISQKSDGTFVVPSQSGNGSYEVCLNPPTPSTPMCTCPDYEERGQPCKHVYAVQFIIQRETNPDGSVTLTRTLTLTEKTTVAAKPTYKQVWPAYNAAQTNEKKHFQELLYELCQGIRQPAPTGKRGRPPILYADMIFAAVFKIYSTFSARRFATDLESAYHKGYMTQLPHYNSLLRYLETPAITPVLKALVAESARPLRAVEQDFAADSTGFTSSRFDRWYDHKYGTFRKKHEWVKVHFMTGVKTNVVTAVEIKGKDAADSPEFPGLVKATAENFTVREVSADKAYCGVENHDAVADAGGTPYLIFKENASGAAGGTFRKMFHVYSLNREDYLRHYHKRSNAESTASMIKAKFGDSVRCKCDTAMTNEALCKVLCHNLCCLIQSAYELGIQATFWGTDEPEPEAAPVVIDATPETADDFADALAWV